MIYYRKGRHASSIKPEPIKEIITNFSYPHILKGFATHRQSNDYSKPGLYFVTLSTRNGESSFGKILDGAMQMSDDGYKVESVWKDISNQYPNVSLDEFIVMPNHVHGIIVIQDNPNGKVKADIFSLKSITALFMSAVTVEINKSRRRPSLPIFHHEFHRRIINHKKMLLEIREFIIDNPRQWDNDDDNPDSSEYKLKQINGNENQVRPLETSAKRSIVESREIMGEEKTKSDLTQIKCVLCKKVIPDNFLNGSYCETCDANYCKADYPQGRWGTISHDKTSMIRRATCPRGHKRGDYKPEGSHRRIKYGYFNGYGL